MKALHAIAFILAVIGGINLGLVGIGNWAGGDWNILHMILGGAAWLESLVYVLIGLSAIYLVFTHKATCMNCSSSSSMPAGAM
jgi:uncharacterized membrane protein YuzA (DUF378 family)